MNRETRIGLFIGAVCICLFSRVHALKSESASPPAASQPASAPSVPQSATPSVPLLYIVTDSGDPMPGPQKGGGWVDVGGRPGTLRYGCEIAAAKATHGLTIRFAPKIRAIRSTLHEMPIQLKSGHDITIDGGADGVTIEGIGLHIGGGAHHITVRNLRVRPGPKTVNISAIVVWGQTTHDVIIEHCSANNASDECIGISARRVLVRHCIIGPSLPTLSGTSHGMLITETADDVVVDRCLFAGCQDRNPSCTQEGGVADVRGNLIIVRPPVVKYGMPAYAFDAFRFRPSDAPEKISKSPRVNWRFNTVLCTRDVTSFIPIYINAQDQEDRTLYAVGNLWNGPGAWTGRKPEDMTSVNQSWPAPPKFPGQAAWYRDSPNPVVFRGAFRLRNAILCAADVLREAGVTHRDPAEQDVIEEAYRILD